MSDIKFDIYESPANDGEKKKYHVRNTNKQTIHSKDLIHEATLYTSVSRSDWAAVVEGLIDILSEKLGDGKRIHINGLGYFSVSIGSTESENPKKMTRGTVQITGVNFQPEKSFKKSIISRAHFVREPPAPFPRTTAGGSSRCGVSRLRDTGKCCNRKNRIGG